jgi:hypothetical protein
MYDPSSIRPFHGPCAADEMEPACPMAACRSVIPILHVVQFRIRNPQSEIALISALNVGQPAFISGQPAFKAGQTALNVGQTALIAGQIGGILGFITVELVALVPFLSPKNAYIYVICKCISRHLAIFLRSYMNGGEKMIMLASQCSFEPRARRRKSWTFQ